MLNESEKEDDQSDDENEMTNSKERKNDFSSEDSSYSEEEIDEEIEEGEKSEGDDVAGSSSDEVTDSEEYDSEDEESEEEIISQSNQVSKPTKSKIISNEVESDSSEDGNPSLKEVCAICLSRMKKEIGSPELCDHSFCLECILEWAKTNNSCPQDRTQFLQIFVRKKVKGKIIRIIKVDEAKPDDIPDDEEEPTFCEVCGRCDREDSLLLCDGCDCGHHLECLDPPLSSVPIEEWFCSECQAINSGRASQEVDIDAREIVDLLEDGGIPSTHLPHRRNNTSAPRRVPRTRASERVMRRINRARISRPSILLDSDEDTNGSDSGLDIEVSSSLPNNSCSSLSPCKKKRKLASKKVIKKKVCKRKSTKKRKLKRKPAKRKGKATIKKKSTRKRKSRKKIMKRKSNGKKKKATSKKGKGKKKSMIQPIVTPKARLAEALGIKPLKNPWQLSVPAMTGSLSQGDVSLMSQRWRAGVPSLSLLGSNSELDYISEPDEYGDAILVAGVQRHLLSTSSAMARRKAIAASTLCSRSIFRHSNDVRICDKPISDSNVSSVSDLLDNIIESQSLLHQMRRPSSDNQESIKTMLEKISKGGGRNGMQMGLGPNSPTRDGDKSSLNSEQSRNSTSSQHYFGSNVNMSSDNFPNYSFGRAASSRDPTGSKAYSSYLRGYSDDGSGADRLPSTNMKNDKKGKKEESRRKGDEEDVNLYSDVEPDFPPCDADEDDDEDFEKEDNNVCKDNDNIEENDPLTSEDELVIDVSDKQDGQQMRGELVANKNISDSTNIEDEVGSSNLPGLNNFELEAVSDTDTHEMDKSMNSSISLSDSNVGDPEVTSSTHELEVPDYSNIPTPPQAAENYGSRVAQNLLFNHSAVGMGLENLETETISDNEEMCFEDNFENEDNIEEGEIPNENPPSALPANRPKINIQLRRVIEVSYPNKEFGDGEYEEGEIVDEAAARKKREKAKKEVDEIVNPSMEEEKKQELLKDNFIPETSCIVTNVAKDNSSPEKINLPEPVKEKEKVSEKEKNVEDDDKLKDKDVSFKKISRSTKVRNYRENENKEIRSRNRFSRERGHSRDKIHRPSRERAHSRDKDQNREKGTLGGHNRERGHSRDKDRNKDRYKDKICDRYKGGSGRRKDRGKKREPKRKEMERYNVRQMITKKEEERKKKDEFGRDVSLREIRPSRSRSKSKSKVCKRSISESNKRSRSPPGKKLRQGLIRKSFSRSTSRSRNLNRPKRKRSYSSSSSTSSSSSSSTSSTSYSSSSSSSRTPSRVGQIREKKRRKSRSKSKSLVKKKIEKKKAQVKPKEKIKKVTVPSPQKKKDEKKKEKRHDKDGIEKEIVSKPDKQKKKRKRDKSPLQSKEVYQAGGSIMVSVNFARNIKENKEKKKKKEKDAKMEVEIDKRKKRPVTGVSSPYRSWSPGRRSLSSGGKHTPLQDEPMWSPSNIHHVRSRNLEAPKSPELIDLDVILVSPPPQEPILISDSEEEEGITRLPPDLGIQQLSPISRNQGPKTPPEPAVKFTLSTKQALKPINNPLQDEEEDERAALVASRGPNTPPGPPPESDESVGRPKSPVQRVPHSPVGTPPVSSPEPDVYDPFEPTKSPSPLERSPQQEACVSSSDQIDLMHKSPTKESSPIKIISPPPPPLPSEPPQSEEKPPEPQKNHEDDSLILAPPSTVLPPISTIAPVPISLGVSKPTTLPGVVILTSAPPTLTSVTSTAQTPVQQIFAGLPANVASILYPAFEAAALRGPANNLLRSHQVAPPIVPPDFSRPPPPTAAMLSRPPPTTISPIKTGDKMKTTLNGQSSISMGDVIDMDLGSPTSPDSSDVSDIFDPPSPHSTHILEKSSPRKPRPHGPVAGTHKISPIKSLKSTDKFEILFGDGRSSKPNTFKSKSNFANKMSKQLKQTAKRNDAEDDIPSSAVDLQVKEKLLKKVQRQERVVDEVKLCLKPFYNKKTISKEDYKDIMKKCVQKVCHNRSGEINPNKIKALVEGYVKKVKYYRKKHVGPILTSNIHSGGLVLPPSVMDPPPPGFGMVSKNHMKLKS